MRYHVHNDSDWVPEMRPESMLEQEKEEIFVKSLIKKRKKISDGS